MVVLWWVAYAGCWIHLSSGASTLNDDIVADSPDLWLHDPRDEDMSPTNSVHSAAKLNSQQQEEEQRGLSASDLTAVKLAAKKNKGVPLPPKSVFFGVGEHLTSQSGPSKLAATCYDGLCGHGNCSLVGFDVPAHGYLFSCLCEPGWTGPSCDIHVSDDRCVDNLELGCENGCSCRGACHKQRPDVFCRCDPGYGGHDCSLTVRESTTPETPKHNPSVANNDIVSFLIADIDPSNQSQPWSLPSRNVTFCISSVKEHLWLRYKHRRRLVEAMRTDERQKRERVLRMATLSAIVEWESVIDVHFNEQKFEDPSDCWSGRKDVDLVLEAAAYNEEIAFDDSMLDGVHYFTRGIILAAFKARRRTTVHLKNDLFVSTILSKVERYLTKHIVTSLKGAAKFTGSSIVLQPTLLDNTPLARATLIHEIGHFLGFRHEHVSEENPFHERAGLCFDQHFRGAKTVQLTHFDAKSVMAYSECVHEGQDANLLSFTLSQTDREGAIQVYGPSLKRPKERFFLYPPVPLTYVYHTRKPFLPTEGRMAIVQPTFTKTCKLGQFCDPLQSRPFGMVVQVGRKRCSTQFGKCEDAETGDWCILPGPLKGPPSCESKGSITNNSQLLSIATWQERWEHGEHVGSPYFPRRDPFEPEVTLQVRYMEPDPISPERLSQIVDSHIALASRYGILAVTPKRGVAMFQNVSQIVNHASVPPKVFTNLWRIFISDNPTSAVEVVDLVKWSRNTLNVLIVQACNLDDLNGDMEVPHLRILRMPRNRLTEWPRMLLKSPRLEYARMSHNELRHLPSDLCERFPLVGYLDVSHNRLTEIPNLSGCQGLTMLDMGHNQVESLPASISDLKSLTHIKARANKLRELPEFSSPFLRFLDVAINFLTSVPDSISKAPNLSKLGLANNLLSSLPETFADFQSNPYFWYSISHNEFERFNNTFLCLLTIDPPTLLPQKAMDVDFVQKVHQNRIERSSRYVGMDHRIVRQSFQQNAMSLFKSFGCPLKVSPLSEAEPPTMTPTYAAEVQLNPMGRKWEKRNVTLVADMDLGVASAQFHGPSSVDILLEYLVFNSLPYNGTVTIIKEGKRAQSFFVDNPLLRLPGSMFTVPFQKAFRELTGLLLTCFKSLSSSGCTRAGFQGHVPGLGYADAWRGAQLGPSTLYSRSTGNPALFETSGCLGRTGLCTRGEVMSFRETLSAQEEKTLRSYASRFDWHGGKRWELESIQNP